MSLSKPKPPAPVNNGRLEVASKPLFRGGRQSSDDDVTVVSQTGPLHELTSNTATRKMVEKAKKVCVFDIAPDKQGFFGCKIVIFLSISFNMCFGCSKEPSHRDGSLEYPKHLFCLRSKKISF